MAIRFSSLSDAQVRELIDSLVQQLASGIASISINGISTTYSTPANIRAAIEELEAELVDRALATAKQPRRAGLVAQYPTLTGKGY